MFVCMFIQQILNPNQTALLLSTAELRGPSGAAATPPSDLTSCLATLQRFRRKHLCQTGLNQQRAGSPLQDRDPLLPSTFKFLLIHLRKTWRRQRPQTPLLQAANGASKRKSLPLRRRLTLHLSCRRNQKPRRRRNLERKNPQTAPRHSRSQVRLRGAREAKTQNWSVWTAQMFSFKVIMVVL